MSDESGRKGGSSFTGRQDTATKTARPTSVGPHHARDKQEDPANPGITPEAGYGAEIARNNEAASKQPAGRTGAAQRPEAGTGEPTLTPEEMEAKSGPPRDAPPLTGTATE